MGSDGEEEEEEEEEEDEGEEGTWSCVGADSFGILYRADGRPSTEDRAVDPLSVRYSPDRPIEEAFTRPSRAFTN